MTANPEQQAAMPPPPDDDGTTEQPPVERVQEAGEVSGQDIKPETQTEAAEAAEGPRDSDQPKDERFRNVREQAETARESHFEIRGIAGSIDYFKRFQEHAPKHLANVLESKDCFQFNKTGGERPAETIATELMSEVEPLVEGLQSELEGSGLTPEQIREGLASVREVLYTIVTKEIMSGGKIRELLGTIHYKDRPDMGQTGEAFGERTDSNKIKGMSVYNEQTGKFDIYFYGGYFRGSKKGQAHVARHELSHAFAEGSDLFNRETYKLFIQYSGNTEITDGQIAEIAGQAPELAEILKIMRNPSANRELYNGYIKSRIDKLATLTGDDLFDERQAVASELVAEMIVPYLASGEDEIGYLAKRFEALDQQKILDFVIQKATRPDGTPCANGQEFADFCKSRGVEIDIESATPAEIISAASSIPELASVFALNQKFFAKLKRSFANRGDNISVDSERNYRHEEEELDDFDDLIDFSDYFESNNYGAGASGGRTAMGAAGKPPQKDFISKLWDFLTARDQRAPALAGGAAAKPTGLPKAA